MFHDLALVSTSALAVFTIMGLAWLATSEREKRQVNATRLQKVEEQLAGALSQLAALDRAKNPLYRESLEDQRARQLNAADSVAVGVEHMLNAIRILSPEMLKKGKRQ